MADVHIANLGQPLTAGQQQALNSFLALGNTPAGFHLAKSGGDFVVTADAGGGGTPAGSNTQLQYNNAGAFGGVTGLTFNGTFVDATSNVFRLQDNTDNTKKALFALNTITTATTRTYTLPDVSGTMTVLGNTSTGSGSIVLATSPTLVTPVLGVASATSINRIAFTQPATGSTLTILDGKTLTVNNTITLAGTDSRVYTFPTTNATIARTDAAQTFQGAQTFANAINGANGADIASAATTDIGAATGNYVNITGTTTITSLGTGAAGITRTVQFAGILTLTHNATSLILPTGANITTAAGDVAMFQSLGTGNWRCTGYMRANGQPLAGGGGTDISCRVTRTANYNGIIGTGAAVAIPWDAETFDTNTMHDNVTNNTRITFNTAGKYQINVVLIPSQNFANGAFAWIRLNGSTNISGTLNKGINLGSSLHVYHLSFSELYSFSAGDYIEIMGQGNTGIFDVSLNSYVTAIKIA